jgi:MFS family permease
MRGALMAAFFACASIGSVLGVMLGGLIAARWGWKSAFGVVGIRAWLMALMFMRVRDYRTSSSRRGSRRRPAPAGNAPCVAVVSALTRSRTMLWVCIGGAGPADRRVRGVVVAAQLPQPPARPAGRPGGRCVRHWWCCAVPSAASCGARSSTAPAGAGRVPS